MFASPSYEVMVVALLASRDVKSNLGSNLAALKEKTKLDPWAAARRQLRICLEQSTRSEVPPKDFWRDPLIRKILIEIVEARYDGDNEMEEELSALANSLVSN